MAAPDIGILCNTYIIQHTLRRHKYRRYTRPEDIRTIARIAAADHGRDHGPGVHAHSKLQTSCACHVIVFISETNISPTPPPFDSGSMILKT